MELMQLIQTIIPIGSVATLFIGLYKFRKDSRKELIATTEKNKEERDSFANGLAKITTLSTELQETANQLKKLERELQEEKHNIANVKQSINIVDEDMNDMQKAIDQLHQISRDQSMSLTRLQQISENLVFAVNGLNERTNHNSEKIAEIKGKITK